MRWDDSYTEVKEVQKSTSPAAPRQNNDPRGFFILLLLALFMASPFIEYDEHGVPQLSKWRQEKLTKELDEIKGAEQYVLLTLENGIYPCYSCVGATTIYLRKGQIWKYGMTTKGERGRYKNKLPGQRLLYVTEFEGTVEECLMEERKKIYYYALHPENLAREVTLIRPPGNKRDN